MSGVVVGVGPEQGGTLRTKERQDLDSLRYCSRTPRKTPLPDETLTPEPTIPVLPEARREPEVRPSRRVLVSLPRSTTTDTGVLRTQGPTTSATLYGTSFLGTVDLVRVHPSVLLDSGKGEGLGDLTPKVCSAQEEPLSDQGRGPSSTPVLGVGTVSTRQDARTTRGLVPVCS